MVACASVMLRLGLPPWPGGVPVSADTFRSTRFFACARVIARVSARCAIAAVELLRVAATAASTRSTSVTSRSRSRTEPITASTGSRTNLFFAKSSGPGPAARRSASPPSTAAPCNSLSYFPADHQPYWVSPR
ncbi:MAG TPA: hypothetical protein VNF47_10365 [Streptosporangiaceae bacterium]|nr:hypothetical protein [Streptosporangiaceae bacterium]